MGIMEKNLPVAESLGEGDMVRIVTGGGNSKNVDVSQIGGGIMFTYPVYDEDSDTTTLDKTFREISEAVANKQLPVLVRDVSFSGDTSIEIGHLSAINGGTCQQIQEPYFIVDFVTTNTLDGTNYRITYGSDSEDGMLVENYNPCEQK